MKLIELILDQMVGVRKPQKKFVSRVFEAFLSVTGKLTFSNISRYIGICERTFARQFSKRFNFAEFNRKAVEMFYGAKERTLAMAFDPFYMSKSGDKTYGKGKFWSGGDGCVKDGTEASLLCIIDVVHRMAFPLTAKQTPNSDEFKKARETEPETTRIDWFVQYIVSMIPMFPAGVTYLLVDAYFFKKKFVTGICEAGKHVICKMRKDAQLLTLYTGPQKPRGRRKKFGGAVDFRELKDIATDEAGITLRSTIAYSVALNRNVLVVKAYKQRSDGRIMEALLFSTNIDQRPIDVYHYYGARFQIEFVIRDAKQHTGLNHCQSVRKERIDFHINTSFASVNIARIKEYERLLESSLSDGACSVATQRIRHHNEMLIRSIFPILGLDPLAIKSNPAYEQALAFGTSFF